LREGFIVGIKGADGKVIVPPVEYDPQTSEALTEMVEVGDAGEVVSWAWVTDPQPDQPLGRPFAWALIKLDGADVPMVHAVDTGGDPTKVTAGTRVKAKWLPSRPTESGAQGEAGEARDPKAPHVYREGHILDIECFVLERLT